MSMYGKNHYNTVISLQLIKINEKKKKKKTIEEEQEAVVLGEKWERGVER